MSPIASWGSAVSIGRDCNARVKASVRRPSVMFYCKWDILLPCRFYNRFLLCAQQWYKERMDQSIISFIFQIAILVMSVVIHEVSHGFMAYALGDSTAKYA